MTEEAPRFQFTPGMIELGNIDIYNRPVVRNEDGSISTLLSMGAEFDGRHYLIPRVSPEGQILSPEDAIALFRNNGQHLGVFDNPAAADEYARKISAESGRHYRERDLIPPR